MSTKFRVSFDIDLLKISPEEMRSSSQEELEEIALAAVTRMLLASNRKASLREMQRVRAATTLTAAEKSQAMAECLRRAKISLQAEANLSIEALPATAVIREDTDERISIAA